MEALMNTTKDAKSQALRQQGVLHAHPQDVTDPLFHKHEFFDPRDLVQVKYEMLRRVQVEGLSITAAAATFGFSRPAFYQAQAAYQRHGLPGLIPRRPGPRRAHKLSAEVLDFVRHHQAKNPGLRAAALSGLIEEALGVTVHPRSLERALARRPKKGG
jgi:transposase